jgi:hypothetical protein
VNRLKPRKATQIRVSGVDIVTSNLSKYLSVRLRGRRIRASLTLIAFSLFAQTIFAQSSPVRSNAKTQAGFSPRDLSGLWMERQNAVTFSSQEPPLMPWSEEKYRSVKPGYGPRATPDSEDPILNCLPAGVPRIMLAPFPMQVIQIPREVIMLFEYDHYIRHIHLDRRDHPKELDLTWVGDSVGWWEGNTLVVDTAGLNDKTWLDQVGHPHSDALHVVERIRRVDRETLQDDVTIDDPKAYKTSWTGQQVFKLRPTWHLLEYVCPGSRTGGNK